MFDRGFAAITRPGRALAVAGVLAVAALAVIPQVGRGSPLPQLQDRNLLLHVAAAPGTSLPEMERITAAAGNELRTVPGVRSVGSHVGRAVGSDQVADVNSAEMWITLDDAADYGRSRAAIETVMRGYPGLRTDLLTYPDDRIAQVMAGQKDDLVVRVYGADLTVLQDKARQIRAMLAAVPGVARPVVRPVPEQPTVDVRVNLAAAQRYGLRPGDVRRDATTLTSGLIVGNLYEQSKIFDVVVWGAPGVRSNLTELGNLLLDTPSGGHVALRDVATLTVRPEPAAISHDDAVRSVEVTAGVTGDPSAVVSAVRSRLARVPMPYEYHAEVFGNATAARASDTRALGYGAVAAVGVFLLLQAAAVSWRRAGLMLASLPLSVVGGVLTAPLAGGAWSAGSLAGLFAVLALAIRASVLLGRRVRGEGGTGIAAAAGERAVPVIQSVLATAAVLLPAAIAGSRAGLEFLHPLAVTMLGGLASLLLVQVFVLPALLLAAAGSEGKPRMSIKHRATAGAAILTSAATLTGCGSVIQAEGPPAIVTPVAGSAVPRLELTGHAIQRLGIRTQPVRPAGPGAPGGRAGVREVIPYSAVVYDTDGSTWTYVNTAARTYLREPVTITAIRDDSALLSAGPPVGAAVVTVGAAELLGTEYDISGEQ
jgi:Cu/Ag efflux pump CusA